ncbi:MAG: hypothetical protein ITG02_01235 [Patulibacter sp.]|nr:hypothetical protein [Patulibacter sp.]
MIRSKVRRWGRLAWGLFVIAIAFYALWQQDRRGDRGDQVSAERDAARAYQRCEQQRPTILVVSVALDTFPPLRQAVLKEYPGALERGRLTVPDCAGTYPTGAAVSHRYPDLTPTRSTP